LSLDEAYLDVTENKTGLQTATRVAIKIREEIKNELQLTASAGVAANKFLAKIASDWKKPDGLFVIQPHQAVAFLRDLPIGRIPGVGKVTEQHLIQAGINTISDDGAVACRPSRRGGRAALPARGCWPEQFQDTARASIIYFGYGLEGTPLKPLIGAHREHR